MPGMRLSFSCSCGYQLHDVEVGATESGHYEVFLCLQCKEIFSVWESTNRDYRKNCRKCGKNLMAVTDPGAWGPHALFEMCPDTEPWMIEGPVSDDESSEAHLSTLLESVRILCPKCTRYSLKFDATVLWD